MVLLVCLAVASAQVLYNGLYSSHGLTYSHYGAPVYGYPYATYGSYGYPAAYVLKK
jgi:hypothetical protein